MSSEVDRVMTRRIREPGSPCVLLGFVLGLLAMSPWAVLYYWFFAPVAALILAGVLSVVAAVRGRVWPVAEGAFAAALFGFVAVVVFAVGVR
ncbi:hypothetical protein H7K45_30375 [Mycobacterium yunnanensis]|uniref:Uncharacterized protein n=1 Tax=Mycobacterium yunnanensis TaxID=368477 RepID=A0A9X2Z881_9MYCO|nr:hypothetical protein [Mycobacterium yunnanensis]MCV7424855.1 hypothetical protein [Mycobacterium yunnanensis]